LLVVLKGGEQYVPGASSTQVDDMGYKREGAEKSEGEQWAWPSTPPPC